METTSTRLLNAAAVPYLTTESDKFNDSRLTQERNPTIIEALNYSYVIKGMSSDDDCGYSSDSLLILY